MKSRVAAQGRAPEDCLILPSIDVIIGETDAIARERQAYVNELVQTEAGMAQMSGHIGVDLSRFPPDQPLADMAIEAGSRGSLDVILQGTEAQGLTLGEAARRFATSELCPQIVGSPETVADQLQDLFEAHACDGFILTPTLMPGMFEQFVRAVVPVLQARGLFRRDYAGTTLREHLRDQHLMRNSSHRSGSGDLDATSCGSWRSIRCVCSTSARKPIVTRPICATSTLCEPVCAASRSWCISAASTVRSPPTMRRPCRSTPWAPGTCSRPAFRPAFAA